MPSLVLTTIIALPIVGALALLFLDVPEKLEGRWDSLPVLLTLTMVAAVLSLAEGPTSWVQALRWLPSALSAPPTLSADALGLRFAALLGLLGVAGTLAGGHIPGRHWGAAFLVWSGAMGMVVAGNLLTLVLAWVICDAGVLVAALQSDDSLSGVLHRVAVNAAGALMLLGGLIVLNGLGAPGLDSEIAALPPRWLALFFVAGVIRAGVYPFHRSAYRSTDGPLLPAVVARVALALAGTYLWLRGLPILQDRIEWWSFLVIGGGLVALLSALLAWGARDLRQLIPWLVGFQLGIILLNLGLGSHVTILLATLELINLALAVTVLGVTAGMAAPVGRAARIWNRGLAFLALASLLGLPPTLGFVTRWGLYRHAIETASLATVLPVAVAGGLLVAPLVAGLRRATAPAAADGSWSPVGSLLVGIPLLLACAQPLLLAPLLAPLSDVPPYPVMAGFIRAADSALSVRIILMILIPVLGGYSLERVHASLGESHAMSALWRFLDLHWLYELLVGAAVRAAVALGIILLFLQASSTVGWAILVGLILLLLVLRR
jgi:multicomponent Na+:H+ antiporter subunit A